MLTDDDLRLRHLECVELALHLGEDLPCERVDYVGTRPLDRAATTRGGSLAFAMCRLGQWLRTRRGQLVTR